MKNILVICTGNTCRSPMAEGIIKDIIKKRGLKDINVLSGGLAALDGDMASKNAIDALAEIGIDISTHRSKSVFKDDLLNADCVYVMTPQHKNVIADALPEVEDKIKVLEIPDPFGLNMDKYRECRDRLYEYFEKELPEEN